MCTTKMKRKTLDSSARLEITCEPENSSFRDEGGRFNVLTAFMVLRTGPQGVPAAVVAAARASSKDGKSVPLKCELQYEDGTPVPERAGKPSIRLFGTAGTGKIKEGPATLDVETMNASVRYRVLKLSRNHDGKKFRLKISLAGVAADVVRPAVTRGTLILSKRKWLRAEARMPEVDARNQLEAHAEKQNVVLADEARSARARQHLSTPVRELAGLAPIEGRYPQPVSVEMYAQQTRGAGGVATASLMAAVVAKRDASVPSFAAAAATTARLLPEDSLSSDDDDDDDDEEYVPRPTSTRGGRKTTLPAPLRALKREREERAAREEREERERQEQRQRELDRELEAERDRQLEQQLEEATGPLLAAPESPAPFLSEPPQESMLPGAPSVSSRTSSFSSAGHPSSTAATVETTQTASTTTASNATPTATPSGGASTGASGNGSSSSSSNNNTSAILTKVLSQLHVLQDQIKQYNETVVESSRRIDILEAENHSLKRQLDIFYDDAPMNKRLKPSQPIVQLGGPLGPLALPRSHSLGVVGEEDTLPPVFTDIEHLFP